MSTSSAGVWPWVALAGLGAYHGLNPTMGWLFAVALGLNRGNRATVLLAIAPIAFGHAVAVAAAIIVVATLGTVLDATLLARVAGSALIAWALWHAIAGHRQRLRVGMRTGLAGLALWSFLMAGAHGAGLMVMPAVLSLCGPQGAGAELTASGSAAVALAALGVHTAAMLAAVAVAAVTVYEWVGVGFLRRGWINLDLIWSTALAASGLILIAR